MKEIIDDRRVGRDHYKHKLRAMHFKSFEKKNNQTETENPVQTSKKEENVDVEDMDSKINEIVEKVAGDNVHDQEILRERLKPFKFESLIGILSTRIKPFQSGLIIILDNLRKKSNKFNKNPRTYNGEPVKNNEDEDDKPGYLAKRHVLDDSYLLDIYPSPLGFV